MSGCKQRINNQASAKSDIDSLHIEYR